MDKIIKTRSQVRHASAIALSRRVAGRRLAHAAHARAAPVMDALALFLTLLPFVGIVPAATTATNETTIYYYGLEESERGLEACGERQACAALLRRYWLPDALMRLCRCDRRRRCDTPAPADQRLELNNRAHLQFCKPITNWPKCTIKDIPLEVQTELDRMNPEELEDWHHRDIEKRPPKINFKCRCRYPYYWKLLNETDSHQTYQCASLPLCKSKDFCGNVSDDQLALYQSCLCPKHHICVHNGGPSVIHISELLYRGKGWRAYCQPISDDYIYEDY